MPMANLLITIRSLLADDAVAVIRQDAPHIIDLLRSPGELLSTVESAYRFAGTELPADNRKFLTEMPSTVQEAARAAIVDAIDRGVTVDVSYEPGVTFMVAVCEWGVGAKHVVNVRLTGPDSVTYAEAPVGFDSLE